MADDAEASAWQVVELAAVDTHPIRLAVLRADTVSKVVTFAEDEWPGARHLGVRGPDGLLVAVSSWIPRERTTRPDIAAVQLRGMATLQHLHGHGLGGLLVEAGCAQAAADGARLVWANARDAALGFYLRHGFAIDSEGFIEQVTGLPHHVIVRELAR
jgi:GNAT superfamily N-acetyltransferase